MINWYYDVRDVRVLNPYQFACQTLSIIWFLRYFKHKGIVVVVTRFFWGITKKGGGEKER